MSRYCDYHPNLSAHQFLRKRHRLPQLILGMRFICFKPDGTVSVEKVRISDDARRRLIENLTLSYTGLMAVDARECLEREALDEFGDLLHQGWEYKKQVTSGITSGRMDAMYAKERRAGAIDGKISGAGELLVYLSRRRRLFSRRVSWRLHGVTGSKRPESPGVLQSDILG